MDRHLDSAVTLQEALDEAWELLKNGAERRPGEFTSREFADQHGVEIARAYKMLERGVGLGVLEKREIVQGRKVNLYRVRE